MAAFMQWEPDLRGYSVAVWRRWDSPKIVYESGDSMDLEANAREMAAFYAIAAHAKPLLERGRLSKEFPAEWTGEHIRDTFVREVIEPRRQAIAAGIFALGFICPVLLIAVAPHPVLGFPLGGILNLSAIALVVWIPGLLDGAEFRAGRLERWCFTILEALMIDTLTSMVVLST